MIMFCIFQDKLLTVKPFWRVDSKISVTSRVLWVFPIFSFSFLTTKVFFLSLIKYCTLLHAFLLFS